MNIEKSMEPKFEERESEENEELMGILKEAQDEIERCDTIVDLMKIKEILNIKNEDLRGEVEYDKKDEVSVAFEETVRMLRDKIDKIQKKYKDVEKEWSPR